MPKMIYLIRDSQIEFKDKQKNEISENQWFELKLSEFAKNAKIIHIDIDPSEMNKMVRPDIEIVGDAKTTLTEINKRISGLDTEPWLNKIEGWRKKYPLSYRKQGGLRMQQVIKTT